MNVFLSCFIWILTANNSHVNSNGASSNINDSISSNNDHEDSLTMSGIEANGRGKVRYDWYQTEAYVVVTVMIRNLIAEQVNVEFSDDTADLSCRLDENTEYTLHLQLFRQINCKESSFKVTSSKVELKMKKAESNRWQQLEAQSGQDGEPLATLKLTQTGVSTATNAPHNDSSHVAGNGNGLDQDGDHKKVSDDGEKSLSPAATNDSTEAVEAQPEPVGPSAPTAVLVSTQVEEPIF